MTNTHDVEFGDPQIMRPELVRMKPEEAAGKTCEVGGYSEPQCGNPALYVDRSKSDCTWTANTTSI